MNNYENALIRYSPETFDALIEEPYHKSEMARICEGCLVASKTKKTFIDAESSHRYMDFISRHRDFPFKYPRRFINDGSMESCVMCGMETIKIEPEGACENTIVYLHGGAYISEITVFHINYCKKLGERLGQRVLVPLYSLAPENTYEHTFSCLAELYGELRRQNGIKITLMGDSAGGGLAAAFCMYLGEIGLEQPDNLILLSPWLDVSMSGDGYDELEAVDPMLSRLGLIEAGKAWAGELSLKDYKVSPMYGDVSMLKNVTMFAGTRELFYPDLVSFYGKLADAGVKCELYIGREMNHVFAIFPIPEAECAFKIISEKILGE